MVDDGFEVVLLFFTRMVSLRPARPVSDLLLPNDAVSLMLRLIDDEFGLAEAVSPFASPSRLMVTSCRSSGGLFSLSELLFDVFELLSANSTIALVKCLVLLMIE